MHDTHFLGMRPLLQAYLEKNQNRQILATEVLKIIMSQDANVEVGPILYQRDEDAKNHKGTLSQKIQSITEHTHTHSLAKNSLLQKLPNTEEERLLYSPEDALK